MGCPGVISYNPSITGSGAHLAEVYWVCFSEMSFPRIDRLVHSDGGPLQVQFISDAYVSTRSNDKQFFLYVKTNQCRETTLCLAGPCISFGSGSK